jgi:glycosyltransferase involved in cell wall biosynthesis
MKANTKLLVVTTHPIQYMAPWFRALVKEGSIDLRVIFLRQPDAAMQGIGFGKAFRWDISLRDGYLSEVLNVRQGVIGLLRFAILFRKIIKTTQPDAVLITGWNERALRLAYPLAYLMGIPIIVRGESNMLRRRAMLPGLLHRAWLRMISGALVIGLSNRQFYSNYGVPQSKLFDGPYFVDSERMLSMDCANRAKRVSLRQEVGFTEEDFVFCFVGKHAPFKQPLLLIEAAAKLRSEGLPVKLVIAGSGELTQVLQRTAREMSVPVHFTGFLNQTELWKVYIPADAMVLPSNEGETWGLVTNEAMLFELPVIVNRRVGCSLDLVSDQGTGIVFDGAADELAEAMRQLVIERHEARRMGKRGRELVLRRFSMPVATAGLKAALDAIARPPT